MPDEWVEGQDVYIAFAKYCDFCNMAGVSKLATVDGATTLSSPARGRWANMCDDHHSRYGVGLGLGRGQRLHLLRDEH